MKYTEEMHQFLKEYMPTHVHAEIVEAFNERFPDSGFTYKHSRAYVKNHKVKTASNGRFQKGCTSYNKGKKMSAEQRAKAAGTMFKSGHTPHNHVPVGTIVVATVGYHKIKLGEPDKWMLYARYLWEQEHGPIPEGHKVIHINGDRLDDRIENLELVKDSELSRINHTKLFGKNEDINKCVISLAKLQDKVAEKIKK